MINAHQGGFRLVPIGPGLGVVPPCMFWSARTRMTLQYPMDIQMAMQLLAWVGEGQIAHLELAMQLFIWDGPAALALHVHMRKADIRRAISNIAWSLTNEILKRPSLKTALHTILAKVIPK